MRTTIHVVSRREYWLYAMGIKRARQEWAARVRAILPEHQIHEGSERLRDLLRDGPKTVKELGDIARGFLGTLSLYVDLVRVPPSGTWERRRADRLALAEDWVGPNDATEDGRPRAPRSELPPGVRAGRLEGHHAVGGDQCRRTRDGAPPTSTSCATGTSAARSWSTCPAWTLPDPETPAPVRFLPHWDAGLLVHARRTGLLPEEHRPRVFSVRTPFSIGTYLVDGRVAGGWSLVKGRIVLDPFEELGRADAAAVERERAALEAFVS